MLGGHSGAHAAAGRAAADGRGALARHTRGALARGLLALGALTLHGTTASAQAAPARDSCAPEPSSAPAPSPAEQVAALYQRFECHFARKEYAACLPYLEQACQLTDSPRCLLNLGAVHHALMHCQLARHYYQQYIDRTPYDEDVPAARGALEELARACPVGNAAASTPAEAIAPAIRTAPVDPPPAAPARSSASAAAPAPARAPPASPRGEGHVLAWTLLGGSAATLTATVVLAAYGARAERDYEARARSLEPAARSSDTELRAIDERGKRSNQLALALGVVSGLLAGAGATLWLKDSWLAEGDPEEGGVSLMIAPDGTALSSYTGRF